MEEDNEEDVMGIPEENEFEKCTPNMDNDEEDDLGNFDYEEA